MAVAGSAVAGSGLGTRGLGLGDLKARMRRTTLTGMLMGPRATRDMETTKRSNMLLRSDPRGKEGACARARGRVRPGCLVQAMKSKKNQRS